MSKQAKWISLGVVALIVVGLLVWLARGPAGGFTTQAVRERIAINTANDSYVYGGADIRWYADTAKATEVVRVDGAAGVAIAAPTSIATATPAALVNSYGVSNLFEVQDAATPVFSINDGGTVVGNVLQYGSSGERAVSSTQTVTGTATVAHGLTTVTWAVCTLGTDPGTGAGDPAFLSIAVSGNVVTAKVWQDDLTAATNPATVHCLVIGTP